MSSTATTATDTAAAAAKAPSMGVFERYLTVLCGRPEHGN